MNINNIIDSTRVLDTETIATDTELALKETITNVALKAPIASPTFTGTATAPTVTATTSFVGKNACTAWVNFDGTTTPPTIRDSFNVSDVVRTATGSFVVYFIIPMSNENYQNAFTASRSDDYTIRYFANDLSVSSIEVFTKNTGDVASNYPYNNLITFGGKA